MLDRINGEVEEQLIKFNKLEGESNGFRLETSYIGSEFDVNEVPCSNQASPRKVELENSLDNLSQELSQKSPQTPQSKKKQSFKLLGI